LSLWRDVALGEVAQMSWGDTSTTKASYTSSGWPAYSASGPDGLLPYADHEQDAVVISAIGAQCGKTWLARGRWSCIKNTMWMRGESGEVQTDFLYYSTKRPDFWPRRGAAQPFISLGDAKRVTVRLPPIATQRRIAAVLSAFDELIEINERRIGLLEQLARSLYREWFVRFRFPGHEAVELVGSELGPIPEGWRPGRLDDHLLLSRGFDLPLGQRSAGDVPVISASGLSGTHSEAKVNGPGVITGRSGTVGQVFYASSSFWPLNTTLWVKDFRLATSRSAYFLLQSLPLQEHAGGAAVPTLNRNHIHGLPVVLPPQHLVSDFDRAVAPMFDLVTVIRDRIRALAAARDLLLPRLVTGRLDLSDIDLGELLPAEAA